MPIRRRLQKFGNSRGVLISREMLEHMGVTDGDLLVLDLVGDALVIRKDGRPAPRRDRVLGTMEAMSQAAPVEGVEELSEMAQRLVDVLSKHDELRFVKIEELIGCSRSHCTLLLREAVEAGRVEKVRRGVYRLADDPAAVRAAQE